MSDQYEMPPFDGDRSDALWGDSGLFDPLSGDSFSEEIANIDAADWGVADELWSEDTADDAGTGDLSVTDFPG